MDRHTGETPALEDSLLFTLALPGKKSRRLERAGSAPTMADRHAERQAHERTRLLATDHSLEQDSGLSDSPSKRAPWTPSLDSIRRKSAVLSEMIGGHSHSEGNPEGEQRTKKSGYDGEFREELLREGESGIRVWYDNFTAIDWLHDSVKHAVRLRKIRSRKRDGVSGFLVNLADGAQGWILVSLVGFFTALVAYAIIASEMVLFDLKEGYCSNGIHLPKRFCCRAISSVPSPSLRSIFAFGFGSSSKKLSAPVVVEHCAGWKNWGDIYDEWSAGTNNTWAAEYVAWIIIAVALSVTASIITIYFSASTSVYSAKDSVNVPSPGFSPTFPTRDLHPIDAELKMPTPRQRKTMYFAAGSGIPEIKTILSGFVIRGYLGSWTLAAKSIGLALSVGSGLSLGKEGPLVHVASCVGNIVSRFFPKYDRNEAKRREIISAACAAGVAVSFGAPIGGVLFSLEEVSFFFPPKVMWRSFFCAMVAAVTLKLLDPFGTGKIVLFQVTYDRDWHTFELLGFLLLGVAGGVYGALFCKANIWWTRNVRNKIFKKHPIVEVALVTIITAVVSFSSPFSRMGGTELVAALFSECHVEVGAAPARLCPNSPQLVWGLVSAIGFAMVTKTLLTVITFGIKLPAGIFIPTLAVGACVGRASGLLVELLHANQPMLGIFDACRAANGDGPLPFGQACVIPGVWAMIGATSFLAGVTRTTVSLAVIMFELTGSVVYTVPVMIAVLASKTVGDALEPRSIYDLVIELSELPYLDAKTEYVHESSPADILDSEALVITLSDDNTTRSLLEKLATLYDKGGGGFPIVAKEEGGLRMHGYISSKELEHGLSNSFGSPSTPCTFRTALALHRGTPIPNERYATPAGHDLSWLMDSAPITLNVNSPMELVHEMFVKLGIRYLVLVNEHGFYVGVLEKNRYLGYLRWLENRKEGGHWPERVPTGRSRV